MEGLSQHVAAKRSLFGEFVATRPGELLPRSVSGISAAADAHDSSGVRRIKIRDFRLLSDSGPGMGGYDLGPGSPELFLASLASCLCHIFLTQAAVLNLRLDVVASKVDALMLNGAGALADETIPGYPHDLRYLVEVMSPETNDALLRLWGAVERHCPIFLLVSRAVPVTGTLRRIVPAGPGVDLGVHRSEPAT